MVDDTHGGSALGVRIVADFRLVFRCGSFYLHFVLNAQPTSSDGFPGRLDACGRVLSAAGEHIRTGHQRFDRLGVLAAC